MRPTFLASLLALFAVPALAEPPNLSVPLPAGCAGRTDVLGLSRVVEIDATGGPRYGTSQYKGTQFLEDGEVVLTFDDGPARRYTIPILDALDAQCTRATFFPVGRMAVADPATLREMAKRGHTVGSHTWSHKNQAALSSTRAKGEIELGISAISEALDGPVAPFFRFPYLGHSKRSLSYLSSRNLAVFSIDIDSRDFRISSSSGVINRIMSRLKSERKGILLFHDIHRSTAKAMPTLLAKLRDYGFKVVHLVAKEQAATLPEYDARAAKILDRKRLVLRKELSSRSGGKTTSKASGESLPWLDDETPKAAGKASPKRTSKTQARKSRDWPPQDADRWQIRSYGD